MNFGERIKELRESKGLLQRQVAASLDMDTPNFSKIERGERKAKREQISVLAKMLGVKEADLFTLWLADKVYDLVKDEDVAQKAMEEVQKKLSLKKYNKS